jgi:hypothetical protein
MSLTPEAVIGLVTLLTTCPPSLLLLWNWFNRRRRAKQMGTNPHLTTSSTRPYQTEVDQVLQRAPSGLLSQNPQTPRQPNIETRLRASVVVHREYGSLSSLLLSTKSTESSAILQNLSLSPRKLDIASLKLLNSFAEDDIFTPCLSPRATK